MLIWSTFTSIFIFTVAFTIGKLLQRMDEQYLGLRPAPPETTEATVEEVLEANEQAEIEAWDSEMHRHLSQKYGVTASEHRLALTPERREALALKKLEEAGFVNAEFKKALEARKAVIRRRL